MKKAMLICGIIVAGHDLYSEPKPDVEAVMYLDTEMPCLQGQTLSGKMVVRNNGNDDIQLLKSVVNPDDLVRSQICLFPNFSEQERKSFSDELAAHVGLNAGDPLRDIVKLNVDYEIENNHADYFVALKKGETLEIQFEGRMMQIPFLLLGGGNRRVPIGAELYLFSDKWVPVEVRPPISVACDARLIPIIAIETGPAWDRTSVRLTRVQFGTNGFLRAKLNSASPSLRLVDLHPDDVVVHSNKVITITQKNGTARTIPEADIPRISAERAEEKRKAREKEMGGN